MLKISRAALSTAFFRVCKRFTAKGSGVARDTLRKSRFIRLTAAALVTIVSLVALLNIGLNLGTPRPMLSRLISVDPQSFDLDYASAWSVWPSLVRVRKVKLRGNDANVQWQIEIDAAWVSVDLLALFGRQFHATKVRAEGIGFRLRQKLEVDAATTDRIAPLPPIVGFDGRPLRGDLPPIDHLAKVPDDLWSVHIENVDGMARQIWIDEVRFEGKARVSGAFFLQPKRLLWVGPAHADILSGTVTLGDAKLLAQVSGSADCRIPPINPSLPVGIEYYRYISGAVRLDAVVPGVHALDYYARIRGIPLSFGGGKGALHFDGALRAGIVRPMNLSLTLRDLAAKTGSWLIGASFEASAHAGGTGPSVWTARLSPLALERAGATVVVVGEQPLQIGTLVDEIDLSRAAPDLEIKGDLPMAQVPDLQVVNEYVSSPDGLHVDGGKASITAQVVASTGTGSANGVVTVDANKMAVRYGALHLLGRIKADVRIAKLLVESGAFDVSKAVVDIRDVSLRDADTVVGGWWGRVESRDAALRPNQAVPFGANFTAKLQNATPVLAFSSRAPVLPDWMVRFLAGGEVSASGRLRAAKAFVELSKLKAQTGLLRVEGDFRKRGEATAGVFRVSSGPLSVGIEINNDDTKLIFIGKPSEPALVAKAQ